MKKLILIALTGALSSLVLSACSGPTDSGTDTGKGTTSEASAEFSRKEIRIVGSSTVYPFTTVVAERFGGKTAFRTPVVESTGSGGGLKLFCSGKGEASPDITNSSRRIKRSEVDNCARNDIHDIVEVKIGFDGIVIANSRKSKQMDISLRDLYLALAKHIPDGSGGFKENTYSNWSEINPALPERKIEVMGPPPTSGTRDAFVELAMEGGCKTFASIKAIKSSDKHRYKELCHTMREDGHFVEAGENDNLIVQKLNANANAFGVFGYSFLEENSDIAQGSTVSGVEPSFENIASGAYPVSRSLYFYVKKDHLGRVPGIAEFVAEFVSDDATGEFGYLTDKGLIPLSGDEHTQWRSRALKLENLDFQDSH